MVIKLFVKIVNESFSNEIKSRTFSLLYPGYCLFWLCKRKTAHKIPGTSAVYWVAWFVESGVYRNAIKAEMVVFGINFILKMFI